ncbi:MAG TPA: transglycosylase domain-containing protein [Patescibacteria group bacterium]|nr:transglycosylase domain-containing protein [Patescibacteria group bacterium]
MAKKATKTKNENNAQNNNFNPVELIAWALSSIGKPIYFVFTYIVLAFIFVFYKIGHTINSIPGKVNKLIKIKTVNKKIVKRKQKRFVFNFPKFSFPKVKFPNLLQVLKLRSLRFSLFELKIIEKLKRFFSKKITRFQKLKLKRRIFIFSLLIIIIALASYFYIFIISTLPSPNQLSQREPQVSTKIYDRNGAVLYKIYKDQNRTLVPLTQIPVHVRLATLAAEDAEFYNHPGFSIKGISRAFFENIKTGSLSGGSTITQQLVKNVLLSPKKTLTRKIKEIVLSVEVEANYTKDQILEMYLNQISYGGTAYGIEEASEQYFGLNVGNIDLAQASYLAGLTKSPTLYSPYGPNPEAGFERQHEVLHLMAVNKFITEEQEKSAEDEKLAFIPNKSGIKAPHFVMYIRSLLVQKYGEEMVEKGGLEVTTSLDLVTEEAAEKIVKDEVTKLKNLNVGNGDALVINPKTGEILAMVGSADYFDPARDGNVNVTLRLRQPGSSIKVVNYAYALSKGGYTPASIINDSPITYVSPGSPPYSPVNYDGQFRGNITLRSALAQSRNIPAVKVLASYGVTKMVEEGKEMGITSWNDPSKFGLSLTLGGGAVTALDLSKVYSTLANYGKRPDLMPILQIKDYKGHVLEKNQPNNTQVLDQRVAFSITDILKDNNSRAPEFGLNSYLVIKDHPEVAVKTGTSNDLRDNWAAGYTQDFLVLTWVGNNNNAPMSRIASGITGASPIWNKIMSFVLANTPSVDWKTPDGVSKINICTLTGTLPCDSCPTRQEWFLDESKPTKACNADQVQKTETPPAKINLILDTGASTVNH